jgi:ergothioneine biosynthesis protein EgtB
MARPPLVDPLGGRAIAERLSAVRRATLALVAPLTAEDCGLQSMPEASPAKWHLAHTTWFFETFVLVPHLPGYRPISTSYRALFNSYYTTLGAPPDRGVRGLWSRPTLDEVKAYRAHVDAALETLLGRAELAERATLALLDLGIAHEEQHQELLLTDLKHAFYANPLRPAYLPSASQSASQSASECRYRSFDARLASIGHAGVGFAFDNECPRHRTWVPGFRLADRLVTVGEYVEFIADRGYEREALWLADGLAACVRHGWIAPLYWELRDGEPWAMTLGGLRRLDPREPVCHVSYYEADAFARWFGTRLPTEAEWEVAAASAPIQGNFVESGWLHPVPAHGPTHFGDAWVWTQSAYAPYPGFRPAEGALGEYNGKFMCNQMVLRGGSCVTPQAHLRSSYRNFFPPEARWQFTGLRLCRDA